MAQTLLINQKYLTDKSVINDNTDYNLLVPVIVVAQDLDIMPLLGSDLYKVIIDAVAAGTIAGDNKTLLDTYIQPCLLYFVMAKSPIILRFRYMNRGVVENQGEGSTQITTDDMKFLEDRYLKIAENYGNQMIKYIKANPDKYPAYFTSYGIDKTSPDRTPFNAGGLYLGDDGYCYKPRNDMDCYDRFDH